MIKITKPIATPSVPPAPVTKVAKARTIFPSKLAPFARIRRVEETFMPRPKIVDISKTEGKLEKSIARGV